MYQSRLMHLSINRPAEEVYAYLADPQNYPSWAAVSGSFVQIGPREWKAETEFGDRIVRFSEPNSFGILDHAIYREGDEPVTMPMRISANGDGCDLTFSFFRRPGVSEEEFASAAEWVMTDFLMLKSLLEV